MSYCSAIYLTTVIQLNQLRRNNFQHIHLIFSRRSLIDMAIGSREFHEYLIMLSMVISSITWVWSYRWQPHLFWKCQREDHVQSLQPEIVLRNYQNTGYSRVMRRKQRENGKCLKSHILGHIHWYPESEMIKYSFCFEINFNEINLYVFSVELKTWH